MPDGSAAALDGALLAAADRCAGSPAAILFQRFYQASVRTSRAAQHQVGFETREDAEPATASLLADTAMVASEALVEPCRQAGQTARRWWPGIMDVVIAEGDKPTAVFCKKGVLTVTVVPTQGLAGRPSCAGSSTRPAAH